MLGDLYGIPLPEVHPDSSLQKRVVPSDRLRGRLLYRQSGYPGLNSSLPMLSGRTANQVRSQEVNTNRAIDSKSGASSGQL